jgi:hypothetical protein
VNGWTLGMVEYKGCFQFWYLIIFMGKEKAFVTSLKVVLWIV